MRRLEVLTVLALTVSPAVFAQSYQHGRVRHVERGRQHPARDGDGPRKRPRSACLSCPATGSGRTRGAAREFQFAGGSLSRLDSASKLDYLNHDDGRDEAHRAAPAVGRLFPSTCATGATDPSEVETPGGA